MKTVRPLIFCSRELAPVAAITLWFLVSSQGCDTGSGQGVRELVRHLKEQKAYVRSYAADAQIHVKTYAKD